MSDLSSKLGPYVAPGFLLAFGLLALGLGGKEISSVLRNSQRTDIPCTTDAADSLERGAWVGVSGCYVDHAGIVEELRGDELETLMIPLYEGEPDPDQLPVAFVSSTDRELLDAYAAASDDDQVGAAVRQHISFDPVTGVTGSVSMTDSERLGEGEGDPSGSIPYVEIRNGEKPGWGLAIFFALVGLVLAALGVYKWPRGQ